MYWVSYVGLERGAAGPEGIHEGKKKERECPDSLSACVGHQTGSGWR